jgi:CheY-like chemotaxis protein
MLMPVEGRKVRIVVIEDNAPDVMLIRECLAETSVPFEIVHFEDGEQALDRLRTNLAEGVLPDMIILDLNMPKVNGMEVLKTIKRERVLASVPVMVLTSSAAPEEREQAEMNGADRFLRKPFDLYEFLEQVGGTVRDLIPSVRQADDE